MLKIKISLIFFLFHLSNVVVADEHSLSTTFSCDVLRHVQVLRTVITEFDKFIATLKIVKSRRAKYVSDSELKLLKSIYENKN